ncbi:hypothetical protein L1887_54443 [Cichorium endivia]|nr:hypothetical protein L1887_54443 [Cichorium endivia]
MHLGSNAPAVGGASNHAVAFNAAPVVEGAAGPSVLHHADSTVLAGLGSHDALTGLDLANAVSKRQVGLGQSVVDLSVGNDALAEEDDASHHHKELGEVESVHLVEGCFLRDWLRVDSGLRCSE